MAWPALGLLLAVFAWWLAARLAGLPEVVLPPPQSVLSAFLVLPAYLVEQTWVTARLTLIGFALAVVGGVLIGVAIAGSRWVERMVSPLLVAFNAVPKPLHQPGRLSNVCTRFNSRPQTLAASALRGRAAANVASFGPVITPPTGSGRRSGSGPGTRGRTAATHRRRRRGGCS